MPTYINAEQCKRVNSSNHSTVLIWTEPLDTATKLWTRSHQVTYTIPTLHA